jgi:hypothetical protein
MEGCFGAHFAENFESLAKLLSDHDPTQTNPTPNLSAKQPGPASIGPQGIFPDVTVAEPKGKAVNNLLTTVSP